eukprot:TRINITY_DN6671_c0_g2_i2.p1 TRINITY_DN6671_c0_g2~~TRINITY_DN6671_c0_g2_i2.p1  ORF type:complete len:2170 (+),score=353.17 TRINITY_DN6671_c0_g2_i2:52-6561(+)
MSRQVNPPKEGSKTSQDGQTQKVDDDVKDSRALAIALRDGVEDSKDFDRWQRHCLRMIQTYKTQSNAHGDDLNEILPLSLAHKENLSNALLSAFQEKIPKDMTDPKVVETLLSALNTIVSNTLKIHLKEKVYYAVVDMLLDNFSPFLLQQDVGAQLIDLAISILNCLYLSGRSLLGGGALNPENKDFKTTEMRFHKCCKFITSFKQSWESYTNSEENSSERSSEDISSLHAKVCLFLELFKRITTIPDGSGVFHGSLLSTLDAANISLGLFNSIKPIASVDLCKGKSNLHWFEKYFQFRIDLFSSNESVRLFPKHLNSTTSEELAIIQGFSMVDSIKECFYKTKKDVERQGLLDLLDPAKYSGLHHLGSPFRTYVSSTRHELQQYKNKDPETKTAIFQKCKIESGSFHDVTLRIKEATGACEDLKTLHKQYVPCRAFLSMTREQYDAFQMIKEFCDPKNEARVLLLVGDSGSGKTSLQQYAIYELWNDFKFRVDSIPLYVSLKSLEDPWKNAIYETLYSPIKNGMNYSELVRYSHSNIKDIKKDHLPIVFFMDDFDDIELKFASIYESNKFAEWPNAKFVISCQKQFTDRYEDYLSMFSPQSRDKNPDLIEEMQLLPFSKEERNRYFTSYIRQNEGIKWKDAVDMEKAFSSIPNLVQLAASPLILALATEMLPELTEEYEKTKLVKKTDSEPMEITKTALYRKCASHCFEKQKGKATGLDSHSPSEVKENFGSYLQEFCKELAYRLSMHSKSMALSTLSQVFPFSLAKEATVDELFKHSNWVKYIKRATPFDCLHSFLLKYSTSTFCDYFLSEYIWDSFNRSSENPSNLKDPKKFCFASPIPLEESLAHQMNTSVLMNLSEYVIQNIQFKDSLFKIVSYSKGKNAELVDETIAAANAITILNYAGVSFAKNTDFQGISIPGADLSCSVLDEADFTGANLYNVNFSYAHLGSCNFNECNMERTQFSKAASPRGHSDIVTSVCLVKSNNEKLALASASRDKTIRIWDLDTGSQIHILRKHTDSVNCICSVKGPEGESWLASGGADQMLHIWNAKTGLHVMELKGYVGSISAICQLKSTENECWVATGGDDCVIRIWDLIENKEIGVLKGHCSSVNVLLMLENDFITTLPGSGAAIPLLASGSSDFSIKIWDIATCKVIFTLRGHTGSITSIANIEMKSGQKCLVSASNDKTIRMWNIRDEKNLKVITAHSESVDFVCKVKSGGNDCLASVSEDKTIRIWELEFFSEVQRFDQRQVTFQPGPSGTYSTEGNVILCIRNNTSFEVASLTDVAGAMQFTSLDRVMNIQTKFIIGPRKLEGGDIQLVNAKGLTKANKSNLLSLGAVSFDKEFEEYCNSKRYTAFQAKNMGYAYDKCLLKIRPANEGIFVKQNQNWIVNTRDYRKAIEWYGKAFDFDSLRQLATKSIASKSNEREKDKDEEEKNKYEKDKVEKLKENDRVSKESDMALIKLQKLAKEKSLNGARKHIQASLMMSIYYKDQLTAHKQMKQSDGQEQKKKGSTEAALVMNFIKWRSRSLDYACLISIAKKNYSVIGLANDENSQSNMKYNQLAFKSILKLSKKKYNHGGLMCPQADHYLKETSETKKECTKSDDKPKKWWPTIFDSNSSKISDTGLGQEKKRLELQEIFIKLLKIVESCKGIHIDGAEENQNLDSGTTTYSFSRWLKAVLNTNEANEDVQLDPNTEKKVLDFLPTMPETLKSVKTHQKLQMGDIRDFKTLITASEGFSKECREASRFVAKCYEKGLGVPKNLAEAAKWYGKANDLGSLVTIASFKPKNDAVIRELSNTFKRLKEFAKSEAAAQIGSDKPNEMPVITEVKSAIAKCYEKELGVTWDPRKAAKWYGKANDLESLEKMHDEHLKDRDVARQFNFALRELVQISISQYEKKTLEYKDETTLASLLLEVFGLSEIAMGFDEQKPRESNGTYPKVYQKEPCGTNSSTKPAQTTSTIYFSRDNYFYVAEAIERIVDQMKTKRYSASEELLSLVAECYEKGWGTEENLKKAIVCYGQAINLVSLQRLTQDMSSNGLLKTCTHDAFEMLKNLANPTTNDKKAKEKLKTWQMVATKLVAECYTNAWGVERDECSAALLYEKIKDFGGLRHLASLGYEPAFEKLIYFASVRRTYGLSKYPEAVRFARECRRKGWGVPKKPSFLSSTKKS